MIAQHAEPIVRLPYNQYYLLHTAGRQLVTDGAVSADVQHALAQALPAVERSGKACLSRWTRQRRDIERDDRETWGAGLNGRTIAVAVGGALLLYVAILGLACLGCLLGGL